MRIPNHLYKSFLQYTVIEFKGLNPGERCSTLMKADHPGEWSTKEDCCC